MPAAPNATAHLHLVSRRTDREYIRLIDRSEDQLILLLQNARVSPAALQQLQPVFDAHHAVAALDAQIQQAQTEIATITKDQDRLRENLKSLKGTPEEKALATRYTGELNAQEDRLAALSQQIAMLKTQRAAADQDFQNKLAAVTFEGNPLTHSFFVIPQGSASVLCRTNFHSVPHSSRSHRDGVGPSAAESTRNSDHYFFLGTGGGGGGFGGGGIGFGIGGQLARPS